ncbi:Thymidine kinase [uncultured virus]|nr:Thymidine kinase [uncultured virus]
MSSFSCDTGSIDDISSIISVHIRDSGMPECSTRSICENVNSHLHDPSLGLDQNFSSNADTSLVRELKLKISNDNEINVIPEKCFDAHRGTLYMRIGPMFSGKTTWLNGELTQLADQGFSVLKITHSDDLRDDVATCDNGGSTHNSSYKSLSDKIIQVRSSSLKNINVSKFHAVGVDESQFFHDLLEVVSDWVEIQGKHVRVAGLDGDAFKRKFGQTLDLIPISDEVIKMKAGCQLCIDELERAKFRGNILSIVGPFTKRLGSSTAQKDVGGSDKYIPVCRYHHST